MVSNTHVIPADGNLERAAKLEGSLLFMDWRKGGQARWWRSSLSREDTGNGPCEIPSLTRVRQGEKVYE